MAMYLKIYHYPARPMPILDGRLVSYFVSSNGLSWHSFPMTTVTHIEYIKIVPCKILIEQGDNTTVLIFDNEKSASDEFELLSLYKNKFSGKPDNCNDIPSPEY